MTLLSVYCQSDRTQAPQPYPQTERETGCANTGGANGATREVNVGPPTWSSKGRRAYDRIPGVAILVVLFFSQRSMRWPGWGKVMSYVIATPEML